MEKNNEEILNGLLNRLRSLQSYHTNVVEDLETAEKCLNRGELEKADRLIKHFE